VTVNRVCGSEVAPSRLYCIMDGRRCNPLRLLVMACQMLWLVLLVRPDAVISTGAAPGFFGVLFGKLTGARTAWIDSMANVSRLSLSGALARPFADLWLTQWPHLARVEGPQYKGSLL
jgi:UDP-N-acetylglucosamine:LPS N-acetylglucosamine transferase